jgi:hypothetical protein
VCDLVVAIFQNATGVVDTSSTIALLMGFSKSANPQKLGSIFNGKSENF